MYGVNTDTWKALLEIFIRYEEIHDLIDHIDRVGISLSNVLIE